jgi:hypothetical protein
MKLCVCSDPEGLVGEAFIVESEEECKSEEEDVYCYTKELDETEEVEEYDEDEDDVEIEDGERLWWEADEADADPW